MLFTPIQQSGHIRAIQLNSTEINRAVFSPKYVSNQTDLNRAQQRCRQNGNRASLFDSEARQTGAKTRFLISSYSSVFIGVLVTFPCFAFRAVSFKEDKPFGLMHELHISVLTYLFRFITSTNFFCPLDRLVYALGCGEAPLSFSESSILRISKSMFSSSSISLVTLKSWCFLNLIVIVKVNCTFH